MALKIFKLEQNVSRRFKYFDSCVVVSESEDTARKIHPWNIAYNENNDPLRRVKFDEKFKIWISEAGDFKFIHGQGDWAAPDQVKVTYIGVADPRYHEGHVICVSFNTG